MKVSHWTEFKRGWFVGNFTPTILASKDVEVAIQRYSAGDYEEFHYHKEADEITMIVSGRVKMNDKIYTENDIIHIEKGESTDFKAITDTITCVVKLPSVIGDKYLGK